MRGFCLECSCEFKEDSVNLTEDGWACPNCNSSNIEKVIEEPKRGTYNYETTKVKYLEGEHD
jgi:DNA-directed RNA polymerase subunit RPC12/RpoP